jgi:hypothetical protein
MNNCHFCNEFFSVKILQIKYSSDHKTPGAPWYKVVPFHRCLISAVLVIDIERRKNRLLKFCYVPTTSAAHNRLLFLLRLFTLLMEQTR